MGWITSRGAVTLYGASYSGDIGNNLRYVLGQKYTT